MPYDPALPSAGHAELVLKIGPDTKIFTEIEPDSAPVVCIQAGEWQVLFYPHSDAEGMHPSQAEADRASEIVIAFSQWRNAIAEKLSADLGAADDDTSPTPSLAPNDGHAQAPEAPADEAKVA